MIGPMSRTELYWQVDYSFYEMYPNAPRPLKNASADWRQKWVELRNSQLNEEVNRVYWARYPDAPTQLDTTSPEWEAWRKAWNDIKDEVWNNVPEPEDVEIENAVSDEGVLDLSHIKARIRERLVDLADEGVILADTRDEAIEVADTLAEEVGAMAMQAGTLHDRWESRTAEVAGLGEQRIRISVTGYWDAGHFTGSLDTVHNDM